MFLQQLFIIESELMEKEPSHHLVQNCLHSTFAVEQLPIHFLRVSYQTHFDETKFLLNLVLGSVNFHSWKMCLINKHRAPNKRRVRINAGSTRPSFK